MLRIAFRGCTCLKCTNQAIWLTLFALLVQFFALLVYFLLWQAAKAERRQMHPLSMFALLVQFFALLVHLLLCWCT